MLGGQIQKAGSDNITTWQPRDCWGLAAAWGCLFLSLAVSFPRYYAARVLWFLSITELLFHPNQRPVDCKMVPNLCFNPETDPGLKLRCEAPSQTMDHWFRWNCNPEIERSCWTVALCGRDRMRSRGCECVCHPTTIHPLQSLECPRYVFWISYIRYGAFVPFNSCTEKRIPAGRTVL